MAAPVRRARNLLEAQRLLSPQPLDFAEHRSPGDLASDPAFYTPPPPPEHLKRRVPGPIDKIIQRLLVGTRGTKTFLSGHVGSGKSTELSRLSVDQRIREQFTVVLLRFEEQEWATLDSSQVLFRMAGALFEFALAEKLLSEKGAWSKALQEIDSALFGDVGVTAREGGLSVEYNLVFVKLKQDLKLSDKRRQQFREFGETRQSVLRDLIEGLVDDVENNLVRQGRPDRLLLLVDDLDKVRGAEAQHEMFVTNLSTLLAPPICAVLTLPTGVLFGSNLAELRQNAVHLYPARILEKSSARDPEAACHEDRLPFFRDVVEHRLEPGLIEPGALRLGAIYSGGVLRDFFHLLREGINIARFNQLDVVDEITMGEAVHEARRVESASLYGPDRAVLAEVHRTHQLATEADRRYLDTSRVLECYNGEVWYEVNPLLWSLLPAESPDAGRKLG